MFNDPCAWLCSRAHGCAAVRMVARPDPHSNASNRRGSCCMDRWHFTYNLDDTIGVTSHILLPRSSKPQYVKRGKLEGTAVMARFSTGGEKSPQGRIGGPGRSGSDARGGLPPAARAAAAPQIVENFSID